MGPLYLLLLPIILIVFFMPSFIAMDRNHEAERKIFILNLVGGITVLGWLAALIWSASGKSD
ncbi:superinfection immunity protein [Pseudomonas putida]|uniref:Superinfection immunity protein n=1 Tax=Pseudomonas putida TaxID=303 RepID=A0A8I1JIL9_PSEPU|nr:superinfection immunity protein [Pseudomonas putida]MBI6885142.1 superinfection immunity protein [Pseudomonas putida]